MTDMRVTLFEGVWTFVNVLFTVIIFLAIATIFSQFASYFQVNTIGMVLLFVIYIAASFVFSLIHSGELKTVCLVSFIPALIFGISAAFLTVYGLGSYVAAVFGFFISYMVSVLGYIVLSRLMDVEQ